MTQKQMWMLLTALVLGLGVNAAPAQCPSEGCGKPSSCPSRTGTVIIGTGVNSDAGLIGSIILNERDFNCTQCPTPASKLGACAQCPSCDACPGCCEKCPKCDGCCREEGCSGCAAGKCPEKHGTITLGVGISLFPGPFPLPVPSMEVNISSAAAPVCAPVADSSATAADAEEPEERQFIVETRLMDMHSGRPEQVLFAPRVTVLEGQAASVSLCGGTAQAGHRGGPLPERLDGLLQVQVEQLDSGNLLLDLTVQKNTVEKSDKRGTVVLCRRLAAIQEVKPGTPMKLILEKDDQGGPRMWMEVLVKDASDKAAIAPPKSAVGCYVPEPGYDGPASVYQLAAPPPQLLPPPAPMTVFVPVPMPPQPAMPCPRPVSELIPCNVPAVVTMPAANMASVFRAIQEDGHARLEVLHGPFSRMTCPSMTWGAPGGKTLKFTVAGERVHVAGDQLNAYANRVIADAENRLVMEGQVRLMYEPACENGAPGTPHRIKADKVIIDLHDGHLQVEMKTRTGE